jgi:hypothetical protein
MTSTGNTPPSTPPAVTAPTRRTAPAGTRSTGRRSAGGRPGGAGTAGGGYQSGWCRPGGNHTRCAGRYAGTRCTCPCHQPATTPEPDRTSHTPAPPSPRRTRHPTTGPTTPATAGTPAAGPPAPPNAPPATQAPPTAAARAGAGRVWDEAEIRALGATTDLVTAGAILGIGRTKSHELARTGTFPVPVLRHGRRYRVPVAPILRLLHLDPAGGQDEREVAIVLQGRLLPASPHPHQPRAGRG